VVLLFDEADSLFSKRGEVKEARDRYANMEVSHLLSRIERHVGPCILTSNLRRHIDAAFTRRFQMVIEFPRPDVAARGLLWQKHIPRAAPRDAAVDIDLLGRELNLSGGQIRNAALHAAFLAAGESKPIGLPHIASAVWTEFGKQGGELSSSHLGCLAPHLPLELAS
jgi:SpoVK/Ycf46/Vps4 family AAA+-type ATPase